jgi:hypothetical protein
MCEFGDLFVEKARMIKSTLQMNEAKVRKDYRDINKEMVSDRWHKEHDRIRDLKKRRNDDYDRYEHYPIGIPKRMKYG